MPKNGPRTVLTGEIQLMIFMRGKRDCTNFVSQVLHDSAAGGLPYINNDNWGFDYDDPDNWYYADECIFRLDSGRRRPRGSQFEPTKIKQDK